jgi:hypothetical protein
MLLPVPNTNLGNFIKDFLEEGHLGSRSSDSGGTCGNVKAELASQLGHINFSPGEGKGQIFVHCALERWPSKAWQGQNLGMTFLFCYILITCGHYFRAN